MYTGDTIPTPRPAVLDSVQPGRFPTPSTCTWGWGGQWLSFGGRDPRPVGPKLSGSSTVSPAQGHIITLIPEKGRAADTLLKGF